MRPESDVLWQEACEQLSTARVCFQGQRWAAAGFHCEQSVQLALKALYVETSNSPHPRLHDLLRLGKLVQTPASLTAELQRLNPLYIETRYPRVGGDPPSRLFRVEPARQAVEDARSVLRWVAQQVGSNEPTIELD